jgi:hypothetical protein
MTVLVCDRREDTKGEARALCHWLCRTAHEASGPVTLGQSGDDRAVSRGHCGVEWGRRSLLVATGRQRLTLGSLRLRLSASINILSKVTAYPR